METFAINWKLAPKEFGKFKRWHKLACPTDTLTAKERFAKKPK